jgi:hypothetical protein
MGDRGQIRPYFSHVPRQTKWMNIMKSAKIIRRQKKIMKYHFRTGDYRDQAEDFERIDLSTT